MARDVHRAFVSVFDSGHGEDVQQVVDTDRLYRDALRFDTAIRGKFRALEEQFDVSFRNKRASLPGSCQFPPKDPATAGDWDGIESISAESLAARYRRFFPRGMRQVLGEFYTPRGLAQLTLTSPDFDTGGKRICDPACGFGIFLEETIKSLPKANRNGSGDGALDPPVVGIDLNPIAARGSKLVYANAIAGCYDLESVDEVHLPVYCGDSLGIIEHHPAPDGDFDLLVGNPPWVTWGNLDDEFKQRFIDRHVDRLGLNPRGGAEARMGHSNDDFSVPFILVAIDRYLNRDGEARFLLKRDLIQQASGNLLRRLSSGSRPLSVKHIHDFPDSDPFDGVGSDTAVFAFRADRENTFPITRTHWSPRNNSATFESIEALEDTFESSESPLIEVGETQSFWLPKDESRPALGTCEHDIRHGIKDDAQSVYSVTPEEIEGLDDELVYPYINSRHVSQFGITDHEYRVVPVREAGEQNNEVLQNRYPATYEYLLEHREELEERSSSWFDDGEFYDVFGVGDYTWSDYKVVWCRLGFKPQFAVVDSVADPVLGEKQVIPGDHFLFIPTDTRDEAHFLCALLNSTPYQQTLQSLASRGKATLSKGVIEQLELPAYSPTVDDMNRLAELSLEAHRGSDERERQEIVGQIDRLVKSRCRKAESVFPEIGQTSLSDFD